MQKLVLLAFSLGIGTRFGLHSNPDSQGIYIVEYLFVVLSVSTTGSQTSGFLCTQDQLLAVCFHRRGLCSSGSPLSLLKCWQTSPGTPEEDYFDFPNFRHSDVSDPGKDLNLPYSSPDYFKFTSTSHRLPEEVHQFPVLMISVRSN